MKRLITCSDGTWNHPGIKDRGIDVKTNVEKMFNIICPEDTSIPGSPVQQLKVYDEGVGSSYSWMENLLQGATGAGIDKNIMDMYLFLVLNYKPGDDIFLFGFSRGAYTARSIGGFVRNCGILKPENIQLIPKAYDLYRDRNDYSTPDSDLMKSFRKNYCYEDITHIKFIGVWDTVGSLGIPLPWYRMRNKRKYKFHDQTLSSTVKCAYHALAIDEKRKPFSPTLWEKSNTVVHNRNYTQKMEQRWFAGVHSNIGGGYADSGLSNIALQWLISKAHEAGLCFNKPPLIAVNDQLDKGELRDSFSLLYRFYGPLHRVIKLDDNTNQTIDESVAERIRSDKTYRPINLKGLFPGIW